MAISRTFHLHPAWIAVALVVVTLAAYSAIGSFDFSNFDDPQYITDNPQVTRGLTWSGVQWAFTTNQASNWHPLTWISHMVDVQIFGLQAGAHHLVNLLLHVINTLLLFGILLRTTGAAGRSALVAALFAVHPLHVESVVWISERKDVLSTLFFMLTLWAYVSYTQHPNLRRYLVVFILLALGLLSKPMLVTMPFVLLLLDVWPLKRINLDPLDRKIITRLVVEKLPLFALIIASSMITFMVQLKGGAVNSLDQASLDLRFSNALVSYVVYIKNMLWPVGLAAIYPIPKSIPLWQPVSALVLLLVTTGAMLKAGRRWPYLPVGWFWYIGTLVPVIGIVQVGTQAMADRYTYIPLIGLFIIIAWGGYDLLGRGASKTKRAPTMALAVLMVAGLATATWVQTQHWVDAKALWVRALTVTSDNYRAHAAYGSLLADEGRNKAAAAQFATAIRIEPRYAEAHNKLGVALAELGRPDEAVSHYRKAVRLRPDFALPHLNLGSALDDKGQVDEAITEYRLALKYKPGLSAAYNNLAAALARQGKFDEAIIEVRAALQLEPGNANYHYNYGALLNRQGDIAQARQHLEAALRLNPQLEGARQILTSLKP